MAAIPVPPALGLTFRFAVGGALVSLLALGCSKAETSSDSSGVTVTQTWTSATLAGTAKTTGTTDATGTAARFNGPTSITTDGAGVFYITDSGNHAIRKLTTAGVVSLFAGVKGTSGFLNGTLTASEFSFPMGVTHLSDGTLAVADMDNQAIRSIGTSTVSTLAGTGVVGATEGLGTLAQFNYPGGVACDTTGNVYVSDTANDTIRIISSTNLVSVLAGSATVSGSANGIGIVARFSQPWGMATDGAGYLYVADSLNHTIRKINLSTKEVSTVAGVAGTSGHLDGAASVATFYSPRGVAVDSDGNILVADTYNHTIRMISTAGVVTTLAGSPEVSGSADGTGTAARFYCPYSIAVGTTGILYIADYGNSTIRTLTYSK